MKGPAALSVNIFFPVVFFLFRIASGTLHKEKGKKRKKKEKEGNRTSVKLYLFACYKPVELSGHKCNNLPYSTELNKHY